jgi:hypothetical protein
MIFLADVRAGGMLRDLSEPIEMCDRPLSFIWIRRVKQFAEALPEPSGAKLVQLVDSAAGGEPLSGVFGSERVKRALPHSR